MRLLARILLPLFIAFGCLASYCQVIDAAICRTTNRFPITEYASYLRSTVPIPIDSVIRLPSGFIKAKDEPVLVFNYDPYYYWFRFVVKNTQDKDIILMLLMAPVGMYEGRLFKNVAGKWSQVAQTGLKYTFRDRSYQSTHYVFPFTVKQQSIDTLYVSINASNVYKSFGFALLQPKDLKIFENKIYFVFGIIVGLLLLFLFLNVSLFFALKEKLHLWYALYIALLFLIVMKNDQLDQQFLGLDSELAFRLTPYLAIGALAIAVLTHVVQIFLKSALINNKLLYRLAIIFKVNMLCSAVIHSFVFVMISDFHIQSIVYNWCKISILIGICIIIGNCIYCITKGFKSALFIFFGSFVFMIGSLQRLFFPSTLSFLFPPTTFHIGIILETFIISMGLIYRYWSEKELQKQREERIQIQTIHDISEEIHDNIGQTLTLANLNLKTIDVNEDKILSNKINDAKTLISKAISDLRDLSRTLKDETKLGIDIAAQIKAECLHLAKTGSFEIEFNIKGKILEIETKKQAIVIRIIKEIFQNVIKHSQASKVEVLLIFKLHTLSMKISDNGIGFDLAKANVNSNGLKNIKSRCHSLHATYLVESQIGSGTQIAIHMPV